MKAMLARAIQALVALPTDEERNRFQSAFIAFVTALPDSLYTLAPSQLPLFDDQARVAKLETKSVDADVPQLAPTDVATLKWFEQKLASPKGST